MRQQKRKIGKGVYIFIILGVIFSLALPWMCPQAFGAPPRDKTKSKFYDFSEQLINGEIRKPTHLYINAREKAKFDRLLKLKKSFLPELFKTAKERIFK